MNLGKSTPEALSIIMQGARARELRAALRAKSRESPAFAKDVQAMTDGMIALYRDKTITPHERQIALSRAKADFERKYFG